MLLKLLELLSSLKITACALLLGHSLTSVVMKLCLAFANCVEGCVCDGVVPGVMATDVREEGEIAVTRVHRRLVVDG